LQELLLSPRPVNPASGFAQDVRLVFGDAAQRERGELAGYVTRLRTEKYHLNKFIDDVKATTSKNVRDDYSSELNAARTRLRTVSQLDSMAGQRFAVADSVFNINATRKKALYYEVVLYVVLSIGLAILVIFLWNLIRDNKRIRQVDGMADVAGLCEMLANSAFSERVRDRVINRLQQLELSERGDLESIEEVATTLHERTTATDRSISRRTAELAVVLQNRYKHRVSSAAALKDT
jgi:hypothetical protein